MAASGIDAADNSRKEKKIMKKFIISVIIFLTILFFVANAPYKRETYCSFIDNSTGTIEFTDFGGNIWAFSDNTDKYQVGARYILKMSENKTPEYIYDDIILKIWKID